MKIKWILATTSIFGLMFYSCNTNNKKEKMETKKVPAIDLANFDTTQNMGDDFYTYVNGGWLKANPLPADKSRFGAFDEIAEENKTRIKGIIENAAKSNAKEGSIAQKIGNFYASGMDTLAIEKIAVKAIKPELDKIDALKDKNKFASVFAHFSKIGIGNIFYIYSAQDKLNSANVIAKFWQGGLTLPDRDYYTSDDPRSQQIRKDYINHLEKMHKFLGANETDAKSLASTIMAMETDLAKISLTRKENRDPRRTLNHKTLEELNALTPAINWEEYFKEIGYPDIKMVNIAQTNFFEGLNKVVEKYSLDNWKAYFKWHILDATASYLNSDIEKQNFDFFGRKLSGQKVQEPRWKRVLGATQGALGMAIGQEYVKKYFPPEAKQRMLVLVDNLKKSLEQRISNLAWMSDSTKTRAINKLHKIGVKVGYPDKWKDYTALTVSKDSYLQNIFNSNLFEFKYTMDKIGKPVDRTEWGMTPQTVNAYYNPNMNEIVFPAGILQPPFFNMNADDAVNYGAIGVVIGHEMTHGFDDQGRQYDGNGNLKDWWTKSDADKYKSYTQKLVDQYNGFSPFEGMHVDGELTLGENIADFGGLTVAYNAYLMSLKGKEAPKDIDGFTDKQRFFIAFAQVWRNQITDNTLKRRLKEDVHSPGKYRVNGALFNVPEFYQAFPQIKETNKLFRTENQRAVIW